MVAQMKKGGSGRGNVDDPESNGPVERPTSASLAQYAERLKELENFHKSGRMSQTSNVTVRYAKQHRPVSAASARSTRPPSSMSRVTDWSRPSSRNSAWPSRPSSANQDRGSYQRSFDSMRPSLLQQQAESENAMYDGLNDLQDEPPPYSPAENAILALLRAIAAAEEHIESFRVRLKLVPSFEPKVQFKRMQSVGNDTNHVTTTEFRKFLRDETSYPVPLRNGDVEALFWLHGGHTDRIEIDDFLRMISPRQWVNMRDGPMGGRARGSLQTYGYQGGARASEARIRLAQLIERELELLREIMWRCTMLSEIHSVEKHDSLEMLCEGVRHSRGGLVQSSLRTGLAAGLSTDEHRLMVRYLGSAILETVTMLQWNSFMGLHERFPAPPRSEISSFTRPCPKCSSPIGRPFDRCPDCLATCFGPLAKCNWGPKFRAGALGFQGNTGLYTY